MPVPRPGALPRSRNPTRGRIACANTASVMATSTWRPRPEDLASISAARIPITGVSAPPKRSAIWKFGTTDASVPDVVDVVSGAIRVRPVLPVAGDRAIHEARIDRGERVVARAEFRHGAGTEPLDQDFGAFCKPQEHLASLRLLQVEADRALVAIDQLEENRTPPARGTHCAGIVSRFRVLDLDDIRPHVGEMQRRHGPWKEARQIEDADAGERLGPQVGAVQVRRDATAALLATACSRSLRAAEGLVPRLSTPA